MIILDHNIPRYQTEKLRQNRIRFRQIGIHVGRPEWDDQQEILRYLHRLRRATFFTRDLGFYTAHLCHRSYCIVVIDDTVSATAEAIVRFLKHPLFRTKALRLGVVAKASPDKLHLWSVNKERQRTIAWNDAMARRRGKPHK